MADHFQGSEAIYIHPGDTSLPFRFQMTVASSSTLNDGMLPNGSSVVSATVTAHQGNGTTAGTSGLIISTTEDANTVVVKLGHSTTLTVGNHHLKFIVTATIAGSTSNLLKQRVDFNRVWVRR